MDRPKLELAMAPPATTSSAPPAVPAAPSLPVVTTAPVPRGLRADGQPPRTAFKPGQSGNPGGLPAHVREARELAGRCAPAAIARLAQIMKQTERPELAVAAAIALLDRAGARPFALEPERLEVLYAGVDSRTVLAALLTRRAVAEPVVDGAGDPVGDAPPTGS